MGISLGATVGSGPIVVAGAHVQGLTMEVAQVPAAGESVLGHGYAEPVDGGKATNQAVCAARLGADVRFVTVLGDDERGRRWHDFLVGEHVDMRWAFTSGRPTDVGFVLIGPDGIPAIATALDANQDLDPRHFEERADVLDGASAVVCQLEASPDFAGAAFRHARTRHVLTILNPSPAQSPPADLVALTDVVIPNEHEAAYLTGRAGDPRELAVQLHRAWPRSCVILTAGEAGVFVCDPDGAQLQVPAPVVDVADTTGAGDAFLGALAARLQGGDALPEAIEAAVIAASHSVTRPGSIPSYGTAGEVAAWAASRSETSK
jgi:ribokinase